MNGEVNNSCISKFNIAIVNKFNILRKKACRKVKKRNRKICTKSK